MEASASGTAIARALEYALTASRVRSVLEDVGTLQKHLSGIADNDASLVPEVEQAVASLMIVIDAAQKMHSIADMRLQAAIDAAEAEAQQ